MAKFAIGDKVIYAPASTSIEMEMGCVVTRLFDPKKGLAQMYSVRDGDGIVWEPVTEDELTALVEA